MARSVVRKAGNRSFGYAITLQEGSELGIIRRLIREGPDEKTMLPDPNIEGREGGTSEAKSLMIMREDLVSHF